MSHLLSIFQMGLPLLDDFWLLGQGMPFCFEFCYCSQLTMIWYKVNLCKVSSSSHLKANSISNVWEPKDATLLLLRLGRYSSLAV